MIDDVEIGQGLEASEYARLDSENKLQVRGTQFPDLSPPNDDWNGWSSNSFEPEQFRALANYMIDLADYAESGGPECAELVELLNGISGDSEAIARALIENGYRK